MVWFVFAAVVYVFLQLGAVTFVVCVVVPPWRKYALSAALWCAVWGPCFIGIALLAVLGIFARDFAVRTENLQSFASPKVFAALGWGYLTLAALATAAVATVASWVHQKVVRRFTFALFRLYAAGVCAGIGSVFGLLLGLLIWQFHGNIDALYGYLLWGASTLVLMVAFANVAYKHAGRLRGVAPTIFPWVTPEEFAGTDVL
jgi:hypothetical protein